LKAGGESGFGISSGASRLRQKFHARGYALERGDAATLGRHNLNGQFGIR
jgi:hypothetical protein